MTAPAPGDQAPAFTLPVTGGGTASLERFRGRKLVLYFYPGDDGPTCTNEALDFTAALADFEAAGAAVLGISPDSVASHEKFARKRSLGALAPLEELARALDERKVTDPQALAHRVHPAVVVGGKQRPAVEPQRAVENLRDGHPRRPHRSA